MKKEVPSPMTRQQFRDAVDHRLSGLTENPWLAQKIMAKETEEPKVKKRLSLGLTMALLMIFAVTIGLAENWDTVSDVLSNGIGAHPDLVANQPEKKELEQRKEEVFDHCIIEQVYAPVTVAVLNEEGTEVSSLALNAPVAQIQYIYKLKKLFPINQEGEREGCSFELYPDRRIAAPEENLPGMPFAPYLFIEAKIVSERSACQFDVKNYSDYRLDFTTGRYSVRYNAKICLNEQGQIIECTEDTITRPFGLVEENGAIPKDSRFQDLSDNITLALNDENELSIHFTAQPTPAPGANDEAIETAAPLPAALPMPLPGAEADEEPARVVITEHTSGDFSSTESFGAYFIGCYTGEGGNTVEILRWQNLYAHFNHSAFENSQFWGQEGTIPWDENMDLLYLYGGVADYHATFTMLSPPQMNVEYRQDRYLAAFTGGSFQITYPKQIYYSDSLPSTANQARESRFDFQYITQVEYATETLPYSFIFELPLPNQ